LSPTSEHKYTLIFLHGLGNSAEGFTKYFYNDKENSILSNRHTKVVLLNAPYVSVTVNGGNKLNSWFDIVTFKPITKINEDTIQENTDRIINRINEEALILKGDP